MHPDGARDVIVLFDPDTLPALAQAGLDRFERPAGSRC
jgi:hypothetical protein